MRKRERYTQVLYPALIHTTRVDICQVQRRGCSELSVIRDVSRYNTKYHRTVKTLLNDIFLDACSNGTVRRVRALMTLIPVADKHADVALKSMNLGVILLLYRELGYYRVHALFSILNEMLRVVATWFCTWIIAVIIVIIIFNRK